jgi:hypothetical protein
MVLSVVLASVLSVLLVGFAVRSGWPASNSTPSRVRLLPK